MSEAPPYQPDLNRIATLLNTMERGALAVALCESPDLRARIMDDLRPLLRRPLHEVALTRDNGDPLALIGAAGTKPGEIVVFTGLESAGEAALKRLEWGREAFWEREANLLFWITGEGQRRLLAEAPNFYSRRMLLAQFTRPAPELLTMLFLDIVGSVALMQALGDEEFERQVIQPFVRRVRDPVQRWGGEVIAASGDSILAVFREAKDAVRCGSAIQQSLALEVIHTPNGPLLLHAGIHSGWPVRSPDYLLGSDVVRTFDVSRAAEGGHLLVSAETRALLPDSLDGLTIVALPSPSEGRERPGTAEVLWEGQTPQAAGRGPIPNNLPPRLPIFTGRGEYLERLAHLLPSPHPVLLVGPGGIGKTALALEAAHSAYGARRFPGGVVWLNLEVDPSLDSLLSTTARALGLSGEGPLLPGELRSAVDDAFQNETCLLVLDGADAAADQAEVWEWVNNLPATVSVLITARRPAAPLPSAELVRVDHLSPHDATTLFIRLAEPRSTVDWKLAGNQAQAERIAELCGGHPLALQIAAGLTSNLTPVEITAGLQSAEAPATDYFSQSVVEWAYGQLDTDAQRTLAGASLFAGPFTIEAIKTVARLQDPAPSLEILESTGLIRTTHLPDGPRSELHPLVREFAAQKVSALPAADTLLTGYVGYYRRLVKDNNDINNLSKLAVLDAEWRSALRAVELAERLKNWRAVGAFSAFLGEFLALRGLHQELLGLSQRAVAAAGMSGDRNAEGGALNNLGVVYEAQGRWKEAEAAYEQSLSIHRENGDRLGEGQTLNNLGIVYRVLGRWKEAETCFQEDLGICRERGDRVGEGPTLHNLGSVYQVQEQWGKAAAAYEQSLAICREYGERVGEGRTLNNLGTVYGSQGRWAEANAAYAQSLAIVREYGDRVAEGQTQENLALLQARQGDLRNALELEREALFVLEGTQAEAAKERARDLIADWEAVLAADGEAAQARHSGGER
ncbi:MAG: tetratricopeptide repeat protein [Actinomycetota bacterium]